VGGSSGTYNQYVNVYNNRIASNAYHSVDIYGQNTGSTYTIDLLLEEVDAYTSSDLRAHLFVTESNVGGYNHVCRLMVPDDQVHLTLTFTLDPSWVSSECQIVAMIQDNNTQEVMQTDKVELDQLRGSLLLMNGILRVVILQLQRIQIQLYPIIQRVYMM